MTIRTNERDEVVQEYSFGIEIKLLLIQSRLFKCKMLSNSQGNHWEKQNIQRKGNEKGIKIKHKRRQYGGTEDQKRYDTWKTNRKTEFLSYHQLLYM